MTQADEAANPEEGDEGKGTETVPKKALNAAIWRERTKAAEVTGELREVRARAEALERELAEARAVPATPPKIYTPDELQEQVAEGKMSESEARTILARQEDQRIDERVDQKLAAQTQAAELKTKVALYQRDHPDIAVPGSDERARVQAEYAALIEAGHPNDIRTEYAALRSLYGPPKEIPETTRETRERSRESAGDSGGGGDDTGDSAHDDGAPRDIPAKNRDWWREQIARGRYPGGWDNKDLKKEVAILRRTAGRPAAR
jgi:hypothetical protein